MLALACCGLPLACRLGGLPPADLLAVGLRFSGLRFGIPELPMSTSELLSRGAAKACEDSPADSQVGDVSSN